MAQPVANLERAYGVTNIKSHIPFTLDMNDHNYDAWRELFHLHCLAFNVLGHIDGILVATGDDDIAWKKRDGLVKLWIYGTLAKPLFQSAFHVGSSARQIWLRVENLFRDNKETRAIQLDNDLRTKEIGDLSVHDYCQELKSIADLMANVGAPVSDRTLVTYLLNGLNAKFDNIINVIKHYQPFPTFEQARSMLRDEEHRLSKGSKPSLTHHASSSSNTILAAVTAPLSNFTSPRPYQNNKVAQGRGNRGKNNNKPKGKGTYLSRPPYPQWPSPQWSGAYPYWHPPPYQTREHPQQSSSANNGLLGSCPYMFPQSQSQHSVLSSASYVPSADFAQAFNTMTLSDPKFDIFAKSLPTTLFTSFRSSLGVYNTTHTLRDGIGCK
ncbi:hypothetical protein AALP_AA8G175400 [Arabis alpina]|uniref:Retrotransposon Copia-like N-terminal domain-containing protein n=1 Tax=Arabis alpina TaxID=50452 RepID=A0A087G7N7_ARAAL|nr:hypothetical protein AALP_AA8G175400 [Arabis alpina]